METVDDGERLSGPCPCFNDDVAVRVTESIPYRLLLRTADDVCWWLDPFDQLGFDWSVGTTIVGFAKCHNQEFFLE